MDTSSNMETLLTNIIKIIDDQRKLTDHIDIVGLSGALEFEDARKTLLLNYISESQELYSNVVERWGDELSLNRGLYHRAVKAVVERITDYNATATVIRDLRPLQEHISSKVLEERMDKLEEIMDLIKTTVNLSCWVLRIQDDELSACQSSHSNYDMKTTL